MKKQPKPILIFLFFLTLLPTLSFAHALKKSTSELTVEGNRAHWILKVHGDDYFQKFGNTDEAHVREYLPTRLGVLLGEIPCEIQKIQIQKIPAEQYVRFDLEFSCPKKSSLATIHYDLFYGDPAHRHILKFEHSSQIESYTFSPENPEITFTQTFSFWREAKNFLKLGFEHILTGYDHILFVLALILGAASFRKLIWMITAFTLAHSLSLALAALDFFQLSPRIIEPIIAGSIVFMAFQGLRKVLKAVPVLENAKENGFTSSIAIIFLFGLVHGLGFSGILKEVHLSQENIIIPLVSFNLGVEFGQLLIVMSIYPLLLLLKRWMKSRYLIFHRIALSLIGLMGFFWLVERIRG